MDGKTRAIAIIRHEHRSIVAVIQALAVLAGDLRDRRGTPDFHLLWSLIYYIDAVPEELHHPKEDQVLFAAIRWRTREIDDVLEELGRQHSQGRPALDRLATLLGRVEAQAPDAEAAFAAAVERYLELHMKHMTIEETVVIPCAERVLTDDDWAEIAVAFTANRDPLGEHRESADERLRHLFQRIVALVPEPWGLGPSAG